MNWPFPSENSAPWYDAFEDMVTALDASGYAAREDRNLVLVGGGNLTWVQSTSTLAWTSDIQILSTITGHVLTVAADSLTLDDGEIAYVNVVRSPTTSSARTPQVASQIQSSDNAFLLAIRVGGNVYFRNGQRLADGETLVGLGAGPSATGGSGLNTQGMGEWRFDTDTTDSDPGSGRWKLNHADETAATFIYMNDQNINGLDASKIIQLLATGSLVYIQRTEDSTEALLYEVSGTPTDGTGYWKIPVTYESEDSGGWAGANNKKYAFVFATAGGSGGGGSTGIGTWTYEATAPNAAGEFQPNTTLASTTGTFVFFHDSNEGGRYRVSMEEIPVGSAILFQSPDLSSAHTYRIDTVTSDATTITYTVTLTNTIGENTWSNEASWAVQFTPGIKRSGIFLAERADHEQTPVDGFAEFWVRNFTPARPAFTDDTGADYALVKIALTTGTTVNGIPVWSSTAQSVQNFSDFTYDGAKLSLDDAAAAELQMAERSTAPTGTAGKGHFWVKDAAPTFPAFTDDVGEDHKLNIPVPTVLATNELIDIDATEVVIGGAYLDGSSGGTYSWEILATYNDNGGTGNQDIEIRLYDRGPDGSPVAGTLRSVLEVTSLDTLDRVSLTLTASGSPGVDTDTIFNTARMYEVRAYLDAGGGVDTAKILSVKFVES